MEPIQFVDLAAQRRRLGDRIDKAIARVLDHGKFIMGPEVYELEERLADYCGARHAITCSSGTDALLLALLAWEVGPGDAVFVPTFTFAATAEVVALVGATPVFVDVDRATFNLDVDDLLRAVARVVQGSDLHAAGVIAVDLFGQPADYDAIRTVTDERGMWLLADAAQSFGATYKGVPTGTLGDVTATSFFPAKPLGCYGDGGAVFTDDDALAGAIRSLRVHGQGADKYDNVRVGINGRLDTLQAAVLLEKLEIFDDELQRRRDVAAWYDEVLGEAADTPAIDAGRTSSWAQYTVLLSNRDAVSQALRLESIPTVVYYPAPLHRQSAYARYRTDEMSLPVADALSKNVLSLPMHAYLDVSTVRAVGAAVQASDRP